MKEIFRSTKGKTPELIIRSLSSEYKIIKLRSLDKLEYVVQKIYSNLDINQNLYTFNTIEKARLCIEDLVMKDNRSVLNNV